MTIASKQPPVRTDRTYFNSGRAAFSYLVEAVIRPRRLYLPSYTCWSLVSAMDLRFPHVELDFYPVRRDLTCLFPDTLEADEALVVIHYFGHVNETASPPGDGTILEDLSHATLSEVPQRRGHSFGSLRKLAHLGDGGFVSGFHNPMYEPTRKLDTWLRYEATDWRELREAENMLDRDWRIADMSSQSLAALFAMDAGSERRRRRENDRILAEGLRAGRPLIAFREGECPLVHQRVFDRTDERDSLRSFLAAQNVFTSIQWQAHPRIDRDRYGDAHWLADHTLAIPVGSPLGAPEMDRVAAVVDRWMRSGGS